MRKIQECKEHELKAWRQDPVTRALIRSIEELRNHGLQSLLASDGEGDADRKGRVKALGDVLGLIGTQGTKGETSEQEEDDE